MLCHLSTLGACTWDSSWPEPHAPYCPSLQNTTWRAISQRLPYSSSSVAHRSTLSLQQPSLRVDLEVPEERLSQDTRPTPSYAPERSNSCAWATPCLDSWDGSLLRYAMTLLGWSPIQSRVRGGGEAVRR